MGPNFDRFDANTEEGPARLAIAVFGSDELALELCRLGRAAGHTLTCISSEGRSDRREPWTRGIRWRTRHEEEEPGDGLEQFDVVVVSPGAGERPSLSEALRTLGRGNSPRRLVWLRGPDEEPGPRVARELVDLRLPRLDEEGGDELRSPDEIAEGAPLPVAQAAMATLRAVVESERSGEIGPRETAELGRSMMVQGAH